MDKLNIVLQDGRVYRLRGLYPTSVTTTDCGLEVGQSDLSHGDSNPQSIVITMNFNYDSIDDVPTAAYGTENANTSSLESHEHMQVVEHSFLQEAINKWSDIARDHQAWLEEYYTRWYGANRRRIKRERRKFFARRAKALRNVVRPWTISVAQPRNESH